MIFTQITAVLQASNPSWPTITPLVKFYQKLVLGIKDKKCQQRACLRWNVLSNTIH